MLVLRVGKRPGKHRRLLSVGVKLVHRLRRWTNITPTLFERLFSWRSYYRYQARYSVLCTVVEKGKTVFTLIASLISPDMRIASSGPQGNTSHRTNAVLMLGHRLRRSPHIKPALVQSLVFAMASPGIYVYHTLPHADIHPSRHEDVPQCCFNVGPPS